MKLHALQVVSVEGLRGPFELEFGPGLNVVHGGNASGKSTIARLIHEGSERGRQPFIDVNVSAIEKELFNSEVYGHEKGSFTGAVGTKKGLVELAHRGTLFLDEIGDLEPAAQIKLLTTI